MPRSPATPEDLETCSVNLGSLHAGGYALVVLRPGAIETHPLPTAGRVVIGRGTDVEVRVADPAISRRHAMIDLGPPLRIADLGSHNGVQVRGRRLAPEVPSEIAPGEPVQLGRVTLIVQRSAPAQGTTVVTRAASATGQDAEPVWPPGIVVGDASTRGVLELIRRVADSDIAVLLLGETGVGKEVMAEAVHRLSPRHPRPFLRLNCAALSPALLESELFGHEKGAFTGALAAKPGLLESAEGGTVFLDEIGELPPAAQVKLLRVLEDHQVTRVGGLAPRLIDVRFVAATHRDLGAEIARGTFRQDLFFRLNGIAIAVPPLRARPGDVAPLTDLFLARLAERRGRAAPAITPQARARLRAYAWPGNVRELRNAIERAAVLAGDHPIGLEHLPPEISQGSPPDELPASASVGPAPGTALKTEMAALERQRILEALERCGGNQTRAAQLLNMRRATLVARLEAYGVPRPRKD